MPIKAKKRAQTNATILNAKPIKKRLYFSKKNYKMSFGGSVSAMISSIKNNSRAKRKTYFNSGNSYSKKGKKKRSIFFDKKATPEQLAEIRNSIIKENKKNRSRNLLFIVTAAVLTILALLFFNS